MQPNKAYAVTELSTEDDVKMCCECGEPAHYVVNHLFATCDNHIIEGMVAYDNMTVTSDVWTCEFE